ncbi:MAG: hypothetical protein GXZ14_00875 [Ruminococcaceae bacterium]|nr:hypothetical protein [Oscillospiraceae bacterium]
MKPELYERLPERAAKLARELEEYLLTDIARRIKKEGRVPSTAWKETQNLLSKGMTEEQLYRRLAKLLKQLSREVEEIYRTSYENAVDDMGYAYEALGIESVFDNAEGMDRLVRAVMRQTAGTFENITRSTGFMIRGADGKAAFVSTQKAYVWALDTAATRIKDGGVPPEKAIHDAVKQLADSGLKTVDFQSGRSIELESAVRTAIVTGMHQISGQICAQQCEELDTDLVEVSAHSGARDKGDGLENHRDWQGGIYSISGTSTKYASLLTETGYDAKAKKGDVRGLKGANCRHDFSPFLDGISIPQWTAEKLAELDKDVIWQGMTFTAYEAQQKMRDMERQIRKVQRDLMVFAALGEEKKLDYENLSIKYMRMRDVYDSFCKAADSPTIWERARAVNWSASAATKARNAAKSAVARLEKERQDDIIREKIRSAGELDKAAVIHLDPTEIDMSTLGFDTKHINGERGRDITREQAIQWINDAKISVTVWGGQYERYYGFDGAVYVNVAGNYMRTAYAKKDFTDDVKQILEVLKNHEH